jgi:hypothetical protein
VHLHSPPERAGSTSRRPWVPPAAAYRATSAVGAVAPPSPQRAGPSTPAGRSGRWSPRDDTLGTCRRSTSPGRCAASAAEPTCPSASSPLPAGCPSRPWRKPRAGGATCPSAPWSEPLSRPGCGWRCSTVPVRRSPGCPPTPFGTATAAASRPTSTPTSLTSAPGATSTGTTVGGPGSPWTWTGVLATPSGPPPRAARGLAAGAARPAPGGRTAAPTGGGAAEPARRGGSPRPRRVQLLLPTGLRRAGRRQRAAGARPGLRLWVRPGLSRRSLAGDDAVSRR